MTVAANTPSVEYLENGVTLAFAVPYRFIASNALEVTRIAADGTVTTLAYGSQWNATGGTTDAGGTLTLLIPSVAGARLRINRATPRAQQADYTTADTFPAESHEGALDKAMLIDQEQDAQIADMGERALLVPVGEQVQTIPSTDERANKFLAFNAAGAPIVSEGTGDDLVLRSDLGEDTGAELVGTGSGRTVEEAIRDVPYNFGELPLIDVEPLGNPTPATKTLLPWHLDATSSSLREYMFTMSMTSNRLRGGPGLGGGDKALIYGASVSTDIANPSDIVCDMWCINPLYAETVNAGVNNARGIEVDFNIYSREYGATDASFTSGPVKFAYDALAAGYFASSAGYHVDYVPGVASKMWNFGFVGGPLGGIKRGVFANLGACEAYLYNRGTVTYGLDIRNATKNRLDGALGVNMTSDPVAPFQVHVGPDRNLIALDFASGVYVAAVNDANNASIPLEFAGSPVKITGILRPSSDNTYTLGASSFRWSVVYAATGTINTSDAATKRIIGQVPDAMLDAVGDVEILIYQYLDAIAEKGQDGAREHTGVTAQALRDALTAHGLDPHKCAAFCADEITETVEETVTVERQVTEMVDVEVERVVMVDGSPIMKKEIVQKERPVFDQVEVKDEDGNVVMIEREAKPARELKDRETGRVTTIPARPAYSGPMTHPVPRMETVEVTQQIERPMLDEEGNPVVRLGVRYTELLVLMQAWTRRELGRLSHRVTALELA